MKAAPPSLEDLDFLGQAVELAKVDQALQEIFGDSGSEEQHGSVRASLINFALYDEDRASLAEDAAILAELTSDAACRSLLICADSTSKETETRSWVQVHCRIDRNGKKSVCTEQLSFLLPGNSPSLLRNVVFSNLDSDLPLAFWWRGELSDAFEEGLYSRIDRLIVDSETWQSPRNQFLRLHAAQQRSASPFVVHDLSFTRLNAVRQAISNAFDRPAVVRSLPSLQTVSIRYAAGFRMSALYLAGWVAHSLGARLESTDSATGRADWVIDRRSGATHFSTFVGELAPDRVGTVEAEFVLDQTQIEVSQCQSRAFLRTITQCPGSSPEENWLPLRRQSHAALVAEILNRAGRNRTYSLVLPRVQQLLA
jgi:glucose-6-phosphate dehydrogenase assembly protein OpcA